jgi:hypothetical protein
MDEKYEGLFGVSISYSHLQKMKLKAHKSHHRNRRWLLIPTVGDDIAERYKAVAVEKSNRPQILLTLIYSSTN